MPRAPLTVRLFPCSRSTLTVDQGALKFVAEQLSGKAPEQMELSSPEGAPLETSLSASDGTAIDCLRDLLKQRAAQRRARHCWEKLTPAGRLAYLQDPKHFRFSSPTIYPSTSNIRSRFSLPYVCRRDAFAQRRHPRVGVDYAPGKRKDLDCQGSYRLPQPCNFLLAREVVRGPA